MRIVARLAALVLTTLATIACSPPYRPAITAAPERAVPATTAYEQSSFEGAGGVSLFQQSWRPRTTPKGVVIVVHGLLDHSSRYAAVAERLVRENYAVYTFDLRGHAHSEGVRVWVSAFDDYLADLDLFVANVRRREGTRPLFIFGHSAGGAIVTLYTITRQPEIRGLVLSAPLLKVGPEVSGPTKVVVRALGAVLPESGVLNLDKPKFSRDPAVLEDCANDPLIYPKGAPARTAVALFGAIGRIQDDMERIKVPLLVLHGAEDSITDPEGSKQLKARARSTDKTLKIYPGLYHDLAHEPEREQVVGDIASWLNAHVEP